MNTNVKAVFFWFSMFAVATCAAFGMYQGMLAYIILAIAILLLA